MNIKSQLVKIEAINYFVKGKKVYTDPHYIEVQKKDQAEKATRTKRTDVINYLLSLKQEQTCYLEIGVRNPADNFNHIEATQKYSVDPGLAFKLNPVDFKMTSDAFFDKLAKNEVLSKDTKFDVIFIDGLHLAEQVDKDIINALNYLKEDGFVVLHDCNPPSEWHAREAHSYKHTPAGPQWNGTTWKAFFKWRCNPSVNSCCINSDWGVGVVSKKAALGKSIPQTNPFFEFYLLDQHRKEHLNLVDFEMFKQLVKATNS